MLGRLDPINHRAEEEKRVETPFVGGRDEAMKDKF
jgi:hypothetical protein